MGKHSPELKLVDVDQPSAVAPAVQLRGVSVAYGGAPVLFSIDASFAMGKMSAIVGPNGAGKSTLLKAALGLVTPLAGDIRFLGGRLSQKRPHVAYVPQRASVDWDFPTSVADVVAMGLYPQIGLLGRFDKKRHAQVMAALDETGMADFAQRQIGELSGGQQQRVFLSRALVQNSDVILLDEPFAAVDASTEKTLVDVLHKRRDAGVGIVAVHHDLATLPAYFDHMLLINRRVIASGPVSLALTDDNLRTAYGGTTQVLHGSSAQPSSAPALA